MSQANRSSPPPPSAHPQTNRTRVRQIAAYLWAEWRVEIFIVLLAALGIFLLVERMQIRQTILGLVRRMLQAVSGIGGGILRGVVGFIWATTLSDMLGYALLLLVAAVVVWRIRWRLMTMPRFTTRQCPRCGGDLHRIHRRRLDRVLDLLVPVARYRCKNSECRWSGLRVKRARHE